jgi:hypothetical protein
MWLKRFTTYILQNRTQAFLLVFFATFLPVVGIVGILIAALVTLTKSATEGALLTLAATVPYLISFYISGDQQAGIPLVIWAAVGVAILSNLLTWVCALMLRKQVSLSVIMQIMALLGVLLISVVHLVYPQVGQWWAAQLQIFYDQAPAMANMLKKPATSLSETQLEWINFCKQYATGLMVAGVLINALLQLLVARWWQSLVFHPGKLRKELHHIRLTQLAGILFAASLVLCYLGNLVVLDIMPVLYLLFAAAGLSLIHYLFALMHSQTTWFWIAILYITLIFSLPISMIAVSILALFDVWLDLRKRFKKT